MKKAILFIAMMGYLAFSSGVMFNFHYCMNKLDSVQLFAPASKKCGKCGMHTDASHGCCRDEVKIVKIDDEQKITAAIDFSVQALQLPAQVPSAYILTAFINSDETGHSTDHSPPLSATKDMRSLLCVFRI